MRHLFFCSRCCTTPLQKHRFNQLITALLFFIFPFTPALEAQKTPMKWGKIKPEMFTMKEFSRDSNAAAVIMCELAESYAVVVNRSTRLDMKVHRRIKILSEAGYEQATVGIPYYAKGNFQTVRKIEGYTYTLGSDGKISKQKLDKKSIFTEDIDGNRKRKRFTMPGLKPGVIIEFRYTLQSKSISYLKGWSFQNDEPTLWSEYRVWVPDFYRFLPYFQGLNQFYINESTPEERYQQMGEWKRWVLKDVPALRKEPFMASPDDYRARIRFQLAEIMIPGEFEKKVLSTWTKLAKQLSEDDDFGGSTKKKKVLPAGIRKKIKALDDPHKQIEAVYNYVKKTIKWTGSRGIYTEGRLADALKKRSGDSPEINFTVISSLRELGLDANPVILSTRDHGRIVPIYPMISQFNDIIAHVVVGDKTYLLDATDPNRALSLLPARVLNGQGLLIKNKNAAWLKITPNGSYKYSNTVSAKLTADGLLTGSINTSDYGYRALEKRKKILNSNESDYIDAYFTSKMFGAKIDSFKIKSLKEIEKPLRTSVFFSNDEAVQAVNNFIYLNPMLLARQENNPYTLPNRSFPVDYAFGRDFTYRMMLTLPEGYTVSEQPKNIAINMPGNAGLFRRVFQLSGNTLSVMSKFVIRKVIFEPEEYAGLQEFYDRVVSAHAEQIVLKKETN